MSSVPQIDNERFRFADWWPLALLVLVLFACWNSLLGQNRREIEQLHLGAKSNQGNVALAFANHTAQLLDRIRLYESTLASGTGDDNERAVVHETLRRTMAIDKSFLRLMQFDNTGALLFSTGRKPEAWLIDAAREFAAQPNNGLTERIAIGAVPPSEYASAWKLPIFFRPSTAGATKYTFVLALVDVAQFPAAFGEIALGMSGEIVLADSDGHELLRMHENHLASVSSIADTERFRLAFSGEEKVSGWLGEREASGDERLYAYRRVPAAPLAVFVSQARNEMNFETKANQRARVSLMAMLTIAGCILAISRIIAIRRRQQLASDLLSIQGSNAELLRQVEAERHAAYQLATYDKLTGLPNRMLFADLSVRYIGRAKRLRTCFAVMFIDLDRFKPINDNYGHKAGDQLLVEVACRLKDCMRETDVVSRHGGDEFVALVSDLRNSQDAAAIATKIIDSLSQPFHGIVNDELRITPSIGIAFYPEDAQQIDDLVRHADAAMYQAKGKGRATFVFADMEQNRRIELSNEIEVALPLALSNREIQVHYQPKVALGDFSICGLEALARWTHPRMGIVSPADFIPTAEKSGLIIELGEYMLTETCRQMSAWMQAGVRVVPVAVNVSWLQLLSPNFFEFVVAALDKSGLAPHFIELEITETGLIHAEGQLMETLHRLRDLGIRLAIDDFGTGYSGLSQLRTLPAKYLKIDKSFIKDIRNDSHDAAIVSNTISLSHSLNLITIAEGVETPEQVAHLKAARCDQAQGYLFSPPCAAQTVERLLHAGYIPASLDN